MRAGLLRRVSLHSIAALRAGPTGRQSDEPDVIEVAASQVSVDVLRLPALPDQAVAIEVRWRDGSPVADAVVRLEDATLQLPGEFRGRSGASSDAQLDHNRTRRRGR
jgi:hypothetical protein